MLKRILFHIGVFALAVLLFSCSEYQRVLKSDDLNYKAQKADEYFKKGDYSKAMPLLEEVANFSRGTAQAEKLQYELAYSYYMLKQYQLSAYHFKNFAESFPYSEHAEEALYLYAYNLYLESPQKDLDQASSLDAINAFQDYLNRYPESTRVDEVNKVIDELRDKIEQKEIENAVLYYKIEDYKAAVWALRNVVQQYPATKDRERLEYLAVKSAYLLAKNSIPDKQHERMLSTWQAYSDFKDKYPSSKYTSELDKLMKNVNDYLQAQKTQKRNEQ